MAENVKIGNPLMDAFDALGRKFRVIEMKYSAPSDEAKRSDLVVVSPDEAAQEQEAHTEALETDDQGESETDQAESVSAKIAALNDQFRSADPSKPCEIKGEWVYGDDVKALAPTVKAAIKKKIRNMEQDDFADNPLRDRGRFVHETKSHTYTVIWLLKVFQDDMMLAEAEHPDDPENSYRLLAVSLSDEDQA